MFNSFLNHHGVQTRCFLQTLCESPNVEGQLRLVHLVVGDEFLQNANFDGNHLKYTLPETNIATENRPLEKEIPIGNHHF